MNNLKLPKRIQIPLTDEMAAALYTSAVRNKRVTRDEAMILLRERLIQLGLLSSDSGAEKPDTNGGGVTAGNIGA